MDACGVKPGTVHDALTNFMERVFRLSYLETPDYASLRGALQAGTSLVPL